MFEGAVVVSVIRDGSSADYASWSEAVPNIRIGDRIHVSWPDGLAQCVDVVARDFPNDVRAWKPMLVPCEA